MKPLDRNHAISVHSFVVIEITSSFFFECANGRASYCQWKALLQIIVDFLMPQREIIDTDDYFTEIDELNIWVGSWKFIYYYGSCRCTQGILDNDE